jgi:hypothetical protein
MKREAPNATMGHLDRIPDAAAWRGYDEDLDVIELHRMFFGKTNAEVQRYFGDARSISRMDELLFAPRPVFQYYVHGFGMFLMSERAKGDSDSASPFLSLLEAREERDPGSVRNIYASLIRYIEFVASHQEYFEAPVEIYGDFKARAQAIREKCGA